MTSAAPLDLVCVSYLADTQLLQVSAYPPANGGTVIDQITASIGADGPLVAITAARLGLRTGLVANGVGADPAGHRLLYRLDAAGVRHGIGTLPDAVTPQLAVIVDDAGTRTWFAALQNTAADLSGTNLHLISGARMVYLDCYRVLTPLALRTIAAADQTPLLLNLGADPLDDAIVMAAEGRQVAAVQTSLDEADSGRAEALACHLFDRLRPDVAVVTLGRLGAVARSRNGLHRSFAPPVAVTHTHGAGSAFSAGYAHALLRGADIDAALRVACETGAAHCTNPLGTDSHRPPTPARAAS